MHLIAGTFIVLFGVGILQAILLEMFNEYDAGSKAAYICGLAACAAFILYGVYELMRAFNYERRIFKTLEPGERREFVAELSENIEMSIPGQVVMTKTNLMAPVNSAVRFGCLQGTDLGCFRQIPIRRKRRQKSR